MAGHHYHGQLLVVYNSQIEIDREPRMRKLTIMGQAIFFMNENEAYPSPDHNASQSFATFEEVFEAVQNYGYEKTPQKR